MHHNMPAADPGTQLLLEVSHQLQAGTIEATFVLQHFTDAAKHGRLGKRTCLYAAFLNVDKACDSLNRTALWDALGVAGIPSHIMRCLDAHMPACTAASRCMAWFPMMSCALLKE